MGFEVAGMGCYNREFARPIRALAREYGVEAVISDDYLDVVTEQRLINAFKNSLLLAFTAFPVSHWRKKRSIAVG